MVLIPLDHHLADDLGHSSATFIPTAYHNPPDGICFQPMIFYRHVNFTR
jgi:hypothetical protein